jgi:adenine/guanine phosphoribosyltransferase-like PRPP-binding protein
MLRRGGLSAEPAVSETGEVQAVLVGRYHGMLDPAGADRLGVLLAELARPLDPNVVVVGEGANDVILGFIVARELGLPLVRVLNLEGLVGASGRLPPRPRAVFVADRVHKSEFASAVGNLLEREGGELAGIVSLVKSTVSKLRTERQGLVTAEEGLRRP